jgi:putative phosphoesterase
VPLVAVVADTHLPRGSRRLSPECVARLEAADLILHAGDMTGAAFLDELRALGPPVHVVCGNADEPTLAAELPARVVVEVGGARIGVTHVSGRAAGREARLLARFPGCDAVVFGHTHLPYAARVDGVWLLNPGSPTERRRAPARSMLELDIRGGVIRPRHVELAA